jgi:glycosyltransferase involved in cell wall biosynthesis
MPQPVGDVPRDPIVLYVGSIFTRRRLPDLIAGFARAAATVPAARLVLVGDNRSRPRIDPRRIADAAGVGHAVEWREYVSDDELDALYARARVFALLSDYEGFLMTPLEAFAHGVPAVLLDTGVAREIYGEAAALVDGTPAGVADALVPLLTDADAHAAAVAAGRARLARATWADTADRVMAALEAAADAT